MPDLPPDPDRLRAIQRHFEAQLEANETVRIYLRLQLDAVEQALVDAGVEPSSSPPAGRPSSSPSPRPESTPARPVLEAPPSRPRDTGFVMDRVRTPNGPEPSSIHLSDCSLVSSLARQITQERARSAIADGLEACSICRPDTQLGMDVD